MTRCELIEKLIAITILSSNKFNVAILLSSFNDAKIFRNEFKKILSELPTNLTPILNRDTIREISYNYVRIYYYALKGAL